MDHIDFVRKEVKPADIISGLNTFPLNNVLFSYWLENTWLTSEIYLDWAKRGIQKNDLYGYSIAITYSKRCVCRRIDALILYNHLYPYQKRNYPAKINALSEIGLKPARIIQKLIIDFRNELEHLYKKPTKEMAEDAIQLSEFYLDATQVELTNGSILVADSSFLFGQLFTDNKSTLWFNGFSEHPMLIVDIFKNEIKIVYPKDSEVIFAKKDLFSTQEAIQFANKLRTHYVKNKSRNSMSILPENFELLLNKASL
jgi:hypothetical protein